MGVSGQFHGPTDLPPERETSNRLIGGLMGSRFSEEGFGEEKIPLATAGLSNPGFLRLWTTDKYNRGQINVELCLVIFENKVRVMVGTMLQKKF